MHKATTDRRLWLAVILLAVGACKAALTGPDKGAVTQLLQQEAQSLKTNGEKLDPSLGVKATWTIVSVDVREQPNDPDRPWAGTIRFKIESRMKDVDGSDQTQTFEKKFEYVYTNTLKQWITQYTPPAR
jgi:hypothetical protein